MNAYLDFIIKGLILTPLLGFILSLLIGEKRENWISKLAIITVVGQFILAITLTVLWILNHFERANLTELTIYQTQDYHFFIDLLIDKTSIAFVLVGNTLSLLVTIFSQYYMHKEDGYKRFFGVILLFYFGYNLTSLSGNFETLFLGWEVLGLASFLLIAFYRYRYLPVKNAVKVFTIYRLGDVGILLAMWLSHHFWHENVTFMKMTDVSLISEHIHQHSALGILIALAVLLAACAKSAQFPFSFWLPRAMEGPTPSSAIFYGSLSVHMGVFLLLRVFPLIEYQISVRVFMGLLGLFSFLVATGISRVQSSVKAQIAYSSIAHIGLIFIEIALGLRYLAIIHFVGNAFLRTYQLLISPSIVSYKIREQFYKFNPQSLSVERLYPKKIEYALYILCLKEFNLDYWMYFYTWFPVKWVGRKLNFLNLKRSLVIIPFILGLAFLAHWLDLHFHIHFLPDVLGVVALLFAIKSFSEKKSAYLAYLLIVFNHILIALAVYFNEHLTLQEIAIYFSGILAMGILGIGALYYLTRHKEDFNLYRFHGHAYEYPLLSIIFLIGCLGLTGFPISPTFLGEDLIFSHIHEHQVVLAALVAFSFVIDGLALIRLYAKIFLGPHSKTYHEIAYRNS